jgi:hypothetical protein
MNLEGNLMLMKTLDDAWNSQEWDAFNKRHSGEFAVYWQGRPEPTKGRSNHKDESVEFFKTFPDNRMVMTHRMYYLAKVTGHFR